MKYIVSILMIVFFCQCELYCPSQTVSQEELDQCNSDDEGWTPCNKGTIEFVSRERLLDELRRTRSILSRTGQPFHRTTDPVVTFNGNVSVGYRNYETASIRIVTYVPARNGSGFSQSSKIVACYCITSFGVSMRYGSFVTDPSYPSCFIDESQRACSYPDMSSDSYY